MPPNNTNLAYKLEHLLAQATFHVERLLVFGGYFTLEIKS